jgi:hypothetical protein
MGAFIVLLIMVPQFGGIRGKVCRMFVSMPVKKVAHIGTFAYYLLLTYSIEPSLVSDSPCLYKDVVFFQAKNKSFSTR